MKDKKQIESEIAKLRHKDLDGKKIRLHKGKPKIIEEQYWKTFIRKAK